jgi:hypothetical protein
MSLPRYVVPKTVLADLALAGLTGQRRQFRTHALRMVPGIYPPLKVLGTENIPQVGPGVITVNHYFRPGFWSVWFPAAISAAVPTDITWTMTDAFTYPGRRFGGLYRAASHWALTRVARVYSFIGMPPMPPAPGELAQRAAAVQRLIACARANPQVLLGMAPEGGDQPGGILTLPPPGFGKLALALARLGLRFYPLGAYEEDGCFFLRFGAPYLLEIEPGAEHAQVDYLARWQVAQAIARCLPERLRGKFVRETINPPAAG